MSSGLSNASMLLVGVAPEIEGKLAKAAQGISLHRAAGELRAALEEAAKHRPATAVVALPATGAAEPTLRVVAQLAQGGARVIVLGPSKDADLILKAMRAGAHEFIVAGQDGELAQAVRAGTRGAAEPAAGSIVSVFGAKGGVGATALAVNLAGALARSGARSLLVDIDLDFGDGLAVLDLAGKYTVTDVIANMHRLDRELLDASVAQHRSGLFVLAQSDRIEEGERGAPKEAAGFYAFLRQHYRHVVLDGLRGFDEHSLTALDASDTVLLVVTQEVPSVRNAQRARELFRRLGYEDAKLKLVVNRYLKGSKIALPMIAETVGLPVAATLGNDFGAVVESVQRGTVIGESAPRSPVTRDVEALARTLSGAGAAAAKPFLSRLFSKG